MFTLVAWESMPIRAEAMDAAGNPASDTYTWTCEPAEMLSFAEGGSQTASGQQVTLRAAGPLGQGSVSVVSGSGKSATRQVQVNAGPAATIAIVAA